MMWSWAAVAVNVLMWQLEVRGGQGGQHQYRRGRRLGTTVWDREDQQSTKERQQQQQLVRSSHLFKLGPKLTTDSNPSADLSHQNSHRFTFSQAHSPPSSVLGGRGKIQGWSKRTGECRPLLLIVLIVFLNNIAGTERSPKRLVDDGRTGQTSAARGERWVDRRLCEGLEFVGSTAVHLHGLSGEQQADVPVEVDLSRLGALEPVLSWQTNTRRLKVSREMTGAGQRQRVCGSTSDERGSARCVRGPWPEASCWSDCLIHGEREQRRSSVVERSGVQLAWIVGRTSQQTSSPPSC